MNSTKLSDIKHEKHEVDAKDQTLGRLATKIAGLLMGKSKTYYVPHLDCGDFVTVTNASIVKVTGKKEKEKLYTSYSGFPGGGKSKQLSVLRKTHPTEIIRHAVWGMLPNNKLRDRLILRLKFR